MHIFVHRFRTHIQIVHFRVQIQNVHFRAQISRVDFVPMFHLRVYSRSPVMRYTVYTIV